MSVLPHPTAILFDWDNTLVDTWSLVHEALHQVFEKRGKTPWTLQEVKDRCHKSGREAFPLLFPDDFQSAMDDYYKFVRERHLEKLTFLPCAQTLLAFIKQSNIPMALVSNKEKELLAAEVKHLKLNELFGAVVGSGDAVRDKPDAALIYLALEQLGVPASKNVWMIGDTIVDWQSAHAAGVSAIGVGGESNQMQEQQTNDAPHVMYKDLEPIYTLLKRG